MTTLFRRALGAVALLLLLSTAAQPAQAQQWAQEIEIVTSVESEQPTRVFLDSLVTAVQERDTLRVRREAGGEEMTLKALQNTLIEDGIGLFSANRAFIEYRFEIRDNRFVEIIQNVHFIFRPPSSGETDVPLLYADASHPVVQQVMTNQGVPNPENLEAISLFRDELSFASLSIDQGADIVAVAGSPIRGEFDQRRKAVLQRFKRFIYDRDKVHITEVQ